MNLNKLDTRQSYDVKINDNKEKNITSNMRDSCRGGNVTDYSIDVELSDNKKKMLQAFKVNSGYYNASPKKNQSPKKGQSPKKQRNDSPPKQKIPVKQPCVVPQIYLFGRKDGDYLTKETEQDKAIRELQTKTMPFKEIKKNYNNKQNNAPTLNDTYNKSIPHNKISIQHKHKDLIKQILFTLGLLNQNDEKLQFQDLMDSAQTKFVEMKSNGRWELIQKYFKGGGCEDDLFYSGTTNRSIIKKKANQQGQKKKVKLIEPDSSSQLIRTKFKLSQGLESTLQRLTKGFIFQKYCYNVIKVQEVQVYLSYDLKCLAWKAKGKDPEIEDMLSYTGITDGARSKNFQSYISKNFPIDEQLAFSIMLKNRTLDLIANTLQYKQEFIDCMKYTKSFI